MILGDSTAMPGGPLNPSAMPQVIPCGQPGGDCSRIRISLPSSTAMPGGALNPSAMPQTQRAPIKLNFGVITAPKQIAVFPLVTATAHTPVLAPAIVSTVAKVGGGTPAGLTQGMPQIGFEQHAGLWTVADAAQPVLNTALSAMTGVAGAPTPGPGISSSISASFVPGQITGNALTVIQQGLASGQAALLDKNSVATGTLDVSLTADPATIAQMAGPTGHHALLSDTAPADLLAQASAMLNGGQVPPDVIAPAGTSKALTYGLIAGGVVAVGIVTYFVMKPKARPNRRRRRYG